MFGKKPMPGKGMKSPVGKSAGPKPAIFSAGKSTKMPMEMKKGGAVKGKRGC